MDTATDDLERDSDAAIAACGGDARATVRALLIANAFLEAELARSAAARRGSPQGRAKQGRD